jgi:glucose-6-phosphate 1-dehydrogenase
MIVTHLFQVLGFVAMEPPTTLDARHLLDERSKVFDAVKPIDVRHVVRGQYEGYRDEPGVPADSTTETMAAVRVEIDNWRWAGVPFFLRTGKRLAAGRQLITLGFHQPTLRMFRTSKTDGPTDRGNKIVIDFADPGSISTEFLAKEPGAELVLSPAEMQFRYEDSFCTANDLEGYERLILDAMLGEQTLFTRADGIERLWEISTPLLEHPPEVETYSPGSWGPEPSLTRLVHPFHWHLATPNSPNSQGLR